MSHFISTFTRFLVIMVRTGESKGSRVSGGKATRKEVTTNRPGAASSVKSSERSTGGNSVQTQPVPVWQQPITDFYQVRNPQSSTILSSTLTDSVLTLSGHTSDTRLENNENIVLHKSTSEGSGDVGIVNMEDNTDGVSMEVQCDVEMKDKDVMIKSTNECKVNAKIVAGTSGTRGVKQKAAESLGTSSSYSSPRRKRIRMDPEMYKHLEEMEQY